MNRKHVSERVQNICTTHESYLSIMELFDLVVEDLNCDANRWLNREFAKAVERAENAVDYSWREA